MASVRVKRMLGDIAQLSDEEQGELLRHLPQVLHRATDTLGLSSAAVREAIGVRERIRRRLADAGQAAGSIAADLDDVREGRLDDLSDDSAPRDLPE